MLSTEDECYVLYIKSKLIQFIPLLYSHISQAYI